MAEKIDQPQRHRDTEVRLIGGEEDKERERARERVSRAAFGRNNLLSSS
jgi:hypothetical protein